MVRRMDEKIDLDLFARLMRTPALARKDILEFLGQGPVSLSALLAEDEDEGVSGGQPPGSGASCACAASPKGTAEG